MVKNMSCVLSLTLILLFSASMNVFAGDLHGTITWQYNNFIGTRGDNGAHIWLCPYNRSVSPTVKEENDWIMRNSDFPEKGLFYAKTDGYGKFEIYGIPEGKYWIWVRSYNTMRDILDKRAIQSDQKLLFACFIHYKENYKDAEVSAIGAFKTVCETIVIRNNNNVFNYDFGNTYI